MIRCQKCENIRDTLDICADCINGSVDELLELKNTIYELQREIKRLKGPAPLPQRLKNGAALDRILYGMDEAMKDYTRRLNEKASRFKKE